MTLKEKALIEKAQQGDRAAFEELIRRYDRKVLTVAMRFTGNMDEAQDIYQEVFLRVFNAIGGFRFQSQFSTWLYRITTNVCLNSVAGSKSRRQVGFEDAEENLAGSSGEALFSSDDAYQATFSREVGLRIEAALCELSPRQRMVVILRHLEGRKLKDIAQFLGCAEGTVKKHLFTGVRRLRERLEGLYE